MHTDGATHDAPNDVRISTMPTSSLAAKFRELPKDFAYLAFDVHGTIHLIVPEALSPNEHAGVITARVIANLCANQQIAKIISEAVVKAQQLDEFSEGENMPAA